MNAFFDLVDVLILAWLYYRVWKLEEQVAKV